MLGISVYLQERIEEEKIRRFYEAGFRSLFTSLHIPEEDASAYRTKLQLLGSIASALDMELIADISTASMEKLDLDWNSAETVLDWGLTGLRIDYGIEDDVIVRLSQEMKVALNASTLTEEQLERLIEAGLRTTHTEVWHNFYPRPETGLARSDFLAKNLLFQTHGLKVQAFIPGDRNLRGPLHQGLPTLEQHRMYGSFAAYKELKVYNVDKILIGDPDVTDEALMQLKDASNTITLRAHYYGERTEAHHLLEKGTHNRPDRARDVIRSEESRMSGMFQNAEIKPFNCIERKEGSITIDNDLYMRYKGEIQITRRNLPQDDKVNVIGQIVPEDVPLLNYIEGGTQFRVIWL
ncbi:DUF871 domain-containing protein [Terribacillus saccharophilus]|uniref:Cell surface protein n=1 Tax=Terribacillus saccharophilus TaxID=361277 RepID=A0ABX4GZJ8_9BACI|nr:MupG family TIM beta-alpha barrel fold protein [Terribacillus saccharophilus]PAD36199.1 hypothetical protein CHH56_05525 [Terribacillus saccharophilus]PAD96720.1 hypothetical protein CHH50_06785 [Terribacillus saccharophilus]PAE00296.1 hypothetical protein CHH48_07690 [Terribacillus saccharophilus]